MSIAVTGASGFIGSAVVRALTARGAQVLSIGRTNPDIDSVPHIDWDIRRPAPQAVHDRASKVAAVVHCAALVDDWGPAEDFHAVNVAGTRHVLDAFPRARFVHMSTTAVYDPHTEHSELYEEAGPVDANRYLGEYGRSKANAESVVARVHPQAAVLRPAPVYGLLPAGVPGDRHNVPYLQRRIHKGVLQLPAAPARTLSLAHIDNVVSATLAALSRSWAHGPVNIADPTPYDLRHALNTYMARAGMEQVHFETQAADLARLRAFFGEKRRRPGGKRPAMTRATVALLTRDRTYAIARLENVLGVEPVQGLAPR